MSYYLLDNGSVCKTSNDEDVVQEVHIEKGTVLLPSFRLIKEQSLCLPDFYVFPDLPHHLFKYRKF